MAPTITLQTEREQPVTLGTFPAGEPLVQAEADLSGIVLIDVRGHSAEQWLQVLALCDMVAAAGGVVDLVVSYWPGGRQDRRDETPLTAQVYARTLDPYPIRSVTVVDPHSDVTPAVINPPTRVISLADVLEHAISTGVLECPDGLIAPDAGAAKKVLAAATRLGLDFCQAHKHRDPVTGRLDGFRIEEFGPGRWLVADDICDGGGTFLGLADAFNRAAVPGSGLALYVTHGIFSKGTDALAERFTSITTTDSFPQTGDVAIVPLADLLQRKTA